MRGYSDIPGWFRWVDKTMFDTLLRVQRTRPLGDVVELGAYLGKSAVVLGDHLRAGERLVVVDLFGADPADFDPGRLGNEANRRENARSYSSLGRDKFEANYRALHEQPPVVVTGPTSAVVDHVAPGSARFVHVDAGHLYDNVHEDVASARRILQPGGVVVFDDYRSEHTPGVAAAVWEAVVTDGLRPFALSGNKFYGTYDGDPTGYVEALTALVRDDRRYSSEVQDIRGTSVLRIGQGRSKPAPPPPPGATLAELHAIAADVVAKVVAGTARSSVGTRS